MPCVQVTAMSKEPVVHCYCSLESILVAAREPLYSLTQLAARSEPGTMSDITGE